MFEINHDINGQELLEETGIHYLPILGYLLDEGYFVIVKMP